MIDLTNAMLRASQMAKDSGEYKDVWTNYVSWSTLAGLGHTEVIISRVVYKITSEGLPPDTIVLFSSRKAVRRVKDKMRIPTYCRYCGGGVRLVDNKEIYGRSYGEWPYAYACVACDSYVGLHPITDYPLGTMANALLRNERKSSKAAFTIMLRKVFKHHRSEAYSYLARKLGIPTADCHFAMFEADQCRKAKEICLARVKRHESRK